MTTERGRADYQTAHPWVVLIRPVRFQIPTFAQAGLDQRHPKFRAVAAPNLISLQPAE
jgi:hypothetical protein